MIDASVPEEHREEVADDSHVPDWAATEHEASLRRLEFHGMRRDNHLCHISYSGTVPSNVFNLQLPLALAVAAKYFFPSCVALIKNHPFVESAK